MRHILLLSALMVGAIVPAYADTTFNLTNNTFTDGATANGTVNIDTISGLIDSIDVTLISGNATYLFTGAPSGQSIFDQGTQYFEESFTSGGDELVIDIAGASLTGYAGGELCSTSNLCGDGYAGAYAVPMSATAADVFPLATGSLVAVTPEPSSLVLLGTGMMGVWGAARRRWSRLG